MNGTDRVDIQPTICTTDRRNTAHCFTGEMEYITNLRSNWPFARADRCILRLWVITLTESTP
ncbi:MAG: hypothetical protein ACJZ57_01420 [Candidatus Poriferisodalaceae bacterium]